MNSTPPDPGTSKGPTWIPPVLWAAALYNAVFGSWVGLFPNAYFRWLELPLPNYPQIWQCVGMIVGVYAIGYGIAATDPLRHWPIILVGFLGKIFGPIGFGWALMNGTLPLRFGWILIANDLIWWGPFSLILYYAWRQREESITAPWSPVSAHAPRENRPS